MPRQDVDGYENILAASTILKAAVDDLFSLPHAAQERARAERSRLGEANHGEDLLCGCWAAAEAATSLMELAGRHVDAVFFLANEHAGFAPSAGVLARAALEGLVRSVWLLRPSDARDREQRWLAMKRESWKFYRNAKAISDSELAQETENVEAISSAIGGGVPVERMPSMEAMVREIGDTERIYDFLYRWNSQPVHATIVGAGTFDPQARQDWMAEGGEGEWIEAEFWGLPMIACWEGLSIALPAYRDLLVPDHPLPSMAKRDEFIRLVRSVPPNFQARKTLAAKSAPAEPREAEPNRAARRAAKRSRPRR